MEYEPLVVGKPGRLAAHVTTLPDFKAATTGALVVTLTAPDGASLSGRADQPSSPGIFRITLTPTHPGKYTASAIFDREGQTDKIDAGTIEVFPDMAAARRANATEKGGAAIAFSKEQQWKTDFATAPVTEMELQPSVRAVGEVRSAVGREARLSATATGRVTLVNPAPVLGMTVKKGQLLAVVAPRLGSGVDVATLDADVETARAELHAAEAQVARALRLFKDEAVPERIVEEARSRQSITRARLAAATGRLDQYRTVAAGGSAGTQSAFKVRSPLDGTLVAANVASGESVEEGRPLFTVIDLTRVWLAAQVFEPDIPKVEAARAAWFTVEGYDDAFTIDERNGRLVTVGRVVDPKSRTVPIIFDVANPGGRLRIGQFANVSIATGKPIRALAIPASALLDEGGKAIAFVQAEGEAFERRVVSLGIRAKGAVQVTSGLASGERVVIRGAYEVRLAASAAPTAQHGHLH
jgi:RND family efflux transporter MFP subunit